MEQKLEMIPVTTNNNSFKSHNQDGLLKKKKEAGPFQFLRVAMYTLRSKTEKSKSTQLQAASKWKNVVGSMRPLHLQGDQSPLPISDPEANKPMMSMNNQLIEHLEVQTPPLSPAQQSSPSASSSSGLSSRYASANDLQELGRRSKYASANDLQELGRSTKCASASDLQVLGQRRKCVSANDLQEFLRSESNDDDNEYGDDEEDKYYDDKRGDEMIDFKAEEFITRFYEQMKIQRQA